MTKPLSEEIKTLIRDLRIKSGLSNDNTYHKIALVLEALESSIKEKDEVIDKLTKAEHDCLIGAQKKSSKLISSWISVKERLPEKESRYWVVASDFFTGGSGIAIYENNEWLPLSRQYTLSVDYWMPMPNPPEDKDDDDE